MQKFSFLMQKIFEGYVNNFSKSSRNQFFYPKKNSDRVGKNTKAAKKFSHHAKVFAWSCKKQFLQPRKPGLLSHIHSGYTSSEQPVQAPSSSVQCSVTTLKWPWMQMQHSGFAHTSAIRAYCQLYYCGFGGSICNLISNCFDFLILLLLSCLHTINKTNSYS